MLVKLNLILSEEGGVHDIPVVLPYPLQSSRDKRVSGLGAAAPSPLITTALECPVPGTSNTRY